MYNFATSPSLLNSRPADCTPYQHIHLYTKYLNFMSSRDMVDERQTLGWYLRTITSSICQGGNKNIDKQQVKIKIKLKVRDTNLTNLFIYLIFCTGQHLLYGRHPLKYFLIYLLLLLTLTWPIFTPTCVKSISF